MMRSIAWLAAIPGIAFALYDPTPEEIEANRRRWARIQTIPGRVAALQNAAKTFQALPKERQEAVLKLDHELTQPNMGHLRDVLARYAAWAESLSKEDRDRLRQVPDRDKRLALIRSLREQDWIRLQPKATRDELASLKDKARTDAIVRLKAEEKRRKFEWTIAQRFWKDLDEKRPLPAHMVDLPADTAAYVQDYLLRMLNHDEKERLQKAEGHWPQFPLALVELADRHPPALPGKDGPKFVADLPKGVQQIAKANMATVKLKFVEGRWPEFAIKVADLAAKRGVAFPNEWWAFGYKALSEPMQKFVEDQLKPKLDREELAKLARAEGRWPEYPETLQKLAADHRLEPPWFTLPRDRKQWDPYRLKPEDRPGRSAKAN